MKALIIGCGYMGKIHSTNLRKLGVEVVQYDIVKEKCDCYVDEIYGQKDVDIVVIATPTKTHYQVFSELYRYYGKRATYLIEKPITESLEQFQRIVKIDGEIFVGHQLRYSEFYAMIRKEIEESPNFDVEMEIRSPSDKDVGLMLDTGIHFIDLPIYYLGLPNNLELQGNRNSFKLILNYDKGVWRIHGELAHDYRIEFWVNEKHGVNDGVSMTFNGSPFQDVDVYYEEVRDVVNYIVNRLNRPRTCLRDLIPTYELAFRMANL